MKFSDLVGMTLVSIARTPPQHDARSWRDDGNELLTFKTNDNRTFVMKHNQDCCESVVIEDINGELEDMLGTPITVAEETSTENSDEGEDSNTWTFYHLGTNKGRVTIRWHGSSNGYYSEGVDFDEIGVAGR